MQLHELALLLKLSHIEGDGNIQFTGVQMDSRKVNKGDLFICVTGHVTDGHQYASQAIAQGAAALVVEHDVEVEAPKLFVKNARDAMAVIANHFYDYPSREMNVLGVTGTNGKSTITYIIEKILSDYGKSVGLMGTIETKIGATSIPMERTTQEAIELQGNLRKMRNLDAAYCVMEVSSHALELGRVKGTHFRTAVFTNLTQDHLDYHKTMEQYKEAKGLLFSRLGNDFFAEEPYRQYAVLNADDEASEYFRKITSAEVITYGIEHQADVKAENIRITALGTEFDLISFAGNEHFKLKLIGRFNVYNTLGAIAAALLEGVPLPQIRSSLEEMNTVAGRMELVDENQDFLVVVDYAHSPDGLENALKTINELAEGNVYCVFGCGGDRDVTKRPIMGRIAAQYSDYVFATSDNPRSEDPLQILKQIEPGIRETGYDKNQYEMIVDRREAIQKAIEKATVNDVVLIAGKGHETYQIIHGQVNHFDDREEAKEALRRKS